MAEQAGIFITGNEVKFRQKTAWLSNPNVRVRKITFWLVNLAKFYQKETDRLQDPLLWFSQLLLETFLLQGYNPLPSLPALTHHPHLQEQGAECPWGAPRPCWITHRGERWRRKAAAAWAARALPCCTLGTALSEKDLPIFTRPKSANLEKPLKDLLTPCRTPALWTRQPLGFGLLLTAAGALPAGLGSCCPHPAKGSPQSGWAEQKGQLCAPVSSRSPQLSGRALTQQDAGGVKGSSEFAWGLEALELHPHSSLHTSGLVLTQLSYCCCQLSQNNSWFSGYYCSTSDTARDFFTGSDEEDSIGKSKSHEYNPLHLDVR